jgi:hypothetical protein
MRDARLDGVLFGDGEYSFRLAWGQLAELQERTDAGPLVVLNRLHSGEWRIEDISNVIRLGLIGGGMSPTDALTKVRRYVEERPPLENHTLAVIILQAGLMGSMEEPVGERVAANQDGSSMTSPTEKSDLPPSTEQVPRSASRRRKSTK